MIIYAIREYGDSKFGDDWDKVHENGYLDEQKALAHIEELRKIGPPAGYRVWYEVQEISIE